MSEDQQVTCLLESWQRGNDDALQELSSLVYGELRRLARRYMRDERDNHTLQATALVNEAFVRLIDTEVSYQNRVHFYTLAGRMMRRVLVDHARSSKREKRGAGIKPLSLHESVMQHADAAPDLLELNSALESLANFDKRKAEIIELQFFAGLNAKEIADVVGVSTRTVERDAHLAKAWLHRELNPD